MPTISASAVRDRRMPMLSAASAAEYTFRILVAIGPCSTINSTSKLATPPNTALTILAGSLSSVTLGMGRGEEGEPYRRHEHSDIAIPEHGTRGDAARHEARIVRRPRDPGNSPALPDRRHQQGQHRQVRARGKRAGEVPIDNPRLAPGPNAHQHHAGDGRRHHILLEGADR